MKNESIIKYALSSDLRRLSEKERSEVYALLCESLGLNPLLRPFEILHLRDKQVFYPTKNCAELLRAARRISLRIKDRDFVNGLYIVVVEATTPDGRVDESIGAVSVQGLSGEALANAIMKAETKAKRRATFSICGLSAMTLDESDSSHYQGVKTVEVEEDTSSEASGNEVLENEASGSEVLENEASGSEASVGEESSMEGDALERERILEEMRQSIENLPLERRKSGLMWLENEARKVSIRNLRKYLEAMRRIKNAETIEGGEK